MDERAWLTELFEDHRVRLRAVAYRMLGSLTEPDDAVQDTWLRLNRADTSGVDNLGAWLTTNSYSAFVPVPHIAANTLSSREGVFPEKVSPRVPIGRGRSNGDYGR